MKKNYELKGYYVQTKCNNREERIDKAINEIIKFFEKDK